MSITTANGLIIVDFKNGLIHGEPTLGAYMLKFSVKYTMPVHEEEKAYFHKTSAKVFIGKKCSLLNIANPEHPKTFKPGQVPQNGGLLYETLLSKDMLDEIEKLRSGGDIIFKLEISGEYYDGRNQSCDSISVPYNVNQSEWIKVLKQMRYRGGLVFELPMEINPSDEVRTALTSIEKAKEHLYYGNYDDVIAKCRISLESIIAKWGNIGTLNKIIKENKKSMTKEQRFFHAINQIANFTHLAHHPNDDGDYVSFTRSEAVFVLGSTISAISSYTEDRVNK